MKILPYDTLTISTSEPLPVVLQRLSDNVEPIQTLRFSTKHASYQGTISEKGFQISRIINYRQPLFLLVKGRFETQNTQTLIHIQISIHPFVMTFLGLFFGFWYSAVVPMTLTDSLSHHMGVLLVGLPIFMVLILWIAFWSEANLNRTKLSQIFQVEV